jgi:hypothetical protein
MIALITISSSASAEPELPNMECKIKFSNIKLTDAAIARIETITSILKGVANSEFSKTYQTLTVKYNGNEITSTMINYTIEALGFKALEITEKSLAEGVSRSLLENDNYFDFLKKTLARKI